MQGLKKGGESPKRRVLQGRPWGCAQESDYTLVYCCNTYFNHAARTMQNPLLASAMFEVLGDGEFFGFLRLFF